MRIDSVAPVKPMALSIGTLDSEGEILGHPRGLAYLIFAEYWERFSYNGMQALLVLYMGRALLLPGHVEHVAGFALFRAAIFSVTGPLPPAALASVIFGLYAGLVYVTPLAGGYIADRWFGRTAMVTAGAILMAIGHFLMAFERSFLLALVCLLLGVGGFKGNLSTQVGALYQPGDTRRSQAFQIYYLGINFAAIFAPLVCGTLGELYGWHWGFAAAGVGMVAGLAVYLSGRRWLPPERLRGPCARSATKAPLSPAEWRRTIVLIALVPVLAVSSLGNNQINNAYLVWAGASYRLSLFGHAIPLTWLLSLGGVSSILMISLSVAFWNWWSRRWPEPSEIGKCTIGALVSALAPLLLGLAALRGTPGHELSLSWAVAFQVINDLGYANLVPVSLALFVRAAPPSISGTMVAVCLLQFFMSNVLAGAVGTLLTPLGGPEFWLLHAGLILGSGLVLLLVSKFFGGSLSPA